MQSGGEGHISILLVDDDPAFADLTAEYLQRKRDTFRTTVAYSAADGLDILDDETDCVVSDYEMPDMDGLEFLRAVRERCGAVPFLLFTGRGSEEIASEAISVGVTDYLQKKGGSDQYELLANRIENAVARRRSERVASETDERYRTLIERSPNAILIHSGERTLYLNDRLAELTGADSREQLYDENPLMYIHPDDREEVSSHIQMVLAEGMPTDWLEWRLKRVDGGIRWMESRGAPVIYNGERCSQVVLRDVTHRHRREKRLQALNEATRSLLTANDRQEVGDIAIDVLAEILDEMLSTVWYNDDGVLRVLTASPEALALAEGQPDLDREPDVPEWSVEYETFQRNSPRVVENYDEREDSLTDALSTVFLVPMEEYGLLATGSVKPRTFEESERTLVSILAQSVQAALERLDE